jgi:hypothetical protein
MLSLVLLVIPNILSILFSHFQVVGLNDPTPTNAPSKKSYFGIFLDGMKDNPTLG